MAKLVQYFASNKLQPNDLGFTAWETAGRRIGPLYDQQATAQRLLGEDTQKLWEAVGKLYGQQYGERAGPAVSTRGAGGYSPTLIGTGSSGNDYANARANAQNEAEENQFNARAHREISRAAPRLVDTAHQLATQISPAPTDAGQTTVLRGGQTPEQVGAAGAGVTVLRGGHPPETPSPSDMSPGGITVLRGGQAPQQVLSYPPGKGRVVELPSGTTGAAGLSPFTIAESPLPNETPVSANPDIAAARVPTPAAPNMAARGVGGAIGPAGFQRYDDKGKLLPPEKQSIETDVATGVMAAPTSAGAKPLTPQSAVTNKQYNENNPPPGWTKPTYGPLASPPPIDPAQSTGRSIWDAITGAMQDIYSAPPTETPGE